jgi:hypothetical protein
MTVFACTIAGVLVGFWLRKHLPEHHLDNETQDSVKQVSGLIATMTALILGLVTASAQDSFTTIGKAVEHSAADIMALDRLLARYGPETAAIRSALHRAVDKRIGQIWPDEQGVQSAQVGLSAAQEVESIGALISTLEPANVNQQWLKSRAMELAESLLAVRWGVFAGQGSGLPRAFLVIIVFLLAVTFATYAMFSPRNGTVTAILAISAFSVACVAFLILELGGPFDGLIKVSPDPLKFARAHIGE